MPAKNDQIIFSFRKTITKIIFERQRAWEAETRNMNFEKDAGLLGLLKKRYEFELKKTLEEEVQSVCSSQEAEMHDIARLIKQLDSLCEQILLEFNQKLKIV